MRIACWIPKATNTHSQYIILIAFPLQQWLQESASVLRYIQGVLRLVDITGGGDFLGLCDKKSSYKHVSDFGRLRSYDRLKLRIEGKDY